jgi:hypothetical protein
MGMEAFRYWEGITPGGLSALLAGLVLVLCCARALPELLGLELRPLPRLVCAYWVSGGAVITGSVLVAGKTGLLSAAGIMMIQGLFLAILVAVLRRRVGFAAPWNLLQGDAARCSKRGLEHLRLRLWNQGPDWWVPLLAWTFLAIVVVLGTVAVLTPTVNHDTHIYRLPRIGMWLQDNHIGHFETRKFLMNFSGRTGEFLMLWLVSFFRSGFPLIQLVQWTAGMVLLAALYELARQFRWPRLARWAAVFILLGMPNVLVQFTTSQTDLIAASFAAAGLVFVHEAVFRREKAAFIMAGLAFGLAVGTKQTMLVWGGAYAVLALVWNVQSGCGWRDLPRLAWPALLVSLPFYLPLFWENYRTYGTWLVPPDFLQDYPSLKPEERVDFLFFPAIWGWHLSWPDVQPPLLFPFTQWLNETCLQLMRGSVQVVQTAGGLPKYAEELLAWTEGGRFGEDIVPPSIAVLLAAAFALPLATLCWIRRAGECGPGLAFGLAAWVAGVCSLHYGWEIYSWRFWVIPSPLFVLAALSLPVLLAPKRPRLLIVWALVLVALHLPVTLRGIWQHGNNGLMTLVRPESTQNRAYAGWMAEASGMLDRRPRHILCREDRFWSSILFRGRQEREARFILPDQGSPLGELEKGHWDTVILSEDIPHLSSYVTGFIPALWGNPLRAVRLPFPGEQASQASWKSGYFADGWIAPEAVLEVDRYASGQLHVSFRNLHPRPLGVKITGAMGSRRLLLPMGEWSGVLEVAPTDRLHFKTEEVFTPAPPDMRQLGVLVRIDDPPPGF